MILSKSVKPHSFLVSTLLVIASLAAGSFFGACAQQIADPAFDAQIAHPTYAGSKPRVAIDEAHKNIHKADRLFEPFADLLRNDGYEVIQNTASFTEAHLQGIDVLVISNPLGELQNNNSNSTSAFTHEECDELYEWVRKGGALFLLADHRPVGEATAPLAKRFGVTLGNGFVFDSNPSNFDHGDPTELVFSERNRLLGNHTIISGRNSSERLHKVVAFTGESVTIPRGGTAILSLASTTGEVPTRDESERLYNDDEATARDNREEARVKWPAKGRALAVAFTVGRGRVVISGEAGMVTAQVFKKQKPDGTDEFVGKMGMNVPGNDNRQYVLNVMHWLSGALK